MIIVYSVIHKQPNNWLATKEAFMENILFKYRTLEPWDRFLDKLLNKRLFAASFEELNDPMEGIFTYSKNQVSPGFIKQLEGRVLTKNKFVPVIVRKVILGHRMSAQQRRLVKVLLSRIDPDIELEQMEREKLDTQTAL
jgi:hypothetical protein